MCGSGTLPIEAALMAGDSAPGLERTTFGFLRWKGHNQKLWGNLLKEAQHRRESGFERLPQIIGYDADRRAVRIALAAVKRAGLVTRIRIEQRDLAKASAPAGDAVVPGLVAVNPPYGERLGETAALHPLYKCLGEVLIAQFSGWKAAVLTGNIELAKSIGLRAVRVNTLYNGSLECKLLQFEVRPERIFKNVPRRDTGPAGKHRAASARWHPGNRNVCQPAAKKPPPSGKMGAARGNLLLPDL
jgi:23S rRNA (guanine2445-N2)-methyltransferase / 23S rRNA (guanine2069-N7)-methyltransferase